MVFSTNALPNQVLVWLLPYDTEGGPWSQLAVYFTDDGLGCHMSPCVREGFKLSVISAGCDTRTPWSEVLQKADPVPVTLDGILWKILMKSYPIVCLSLPHVALVLGDEAIPRISSITQTLISDKIDKTDVLISLLCRFSIEVSEQSQCDLLSPVD